LHALVGLAFALGALLPPLVRAQDSSSKEGAERGKRVPPTEPPIELVSSAKPDTNERQWFTGRYFPDPVVVRITGRRDRAACEDTTKPQDYVQFYSLQPSSSRDPNSRTVAPAWNERFGCIVIFRWLLSDETGEQDLMVRLVHSNDNKPELGYAMINPPLRVLAHSPPNLIIGAALESRTIRTGGGSGDTSQFEPVVGIDVPAYFPISRKFWLKNVRLVIATSLKDVGSDLHIGLSWLPLLTGVRGEGFPIQGYSGYRFGLSGRKDSWTIFALTYNASSAISTILRVFTR
jgi:hypothetical protein